MTAPDKAAQGPSERAKAWYVNKVQEPALAAGLVVPVVSTNNAKSRMLDFDAGYAAAERQSKGEHICSRCGLREDGEKDGDVDF